MKAQMPAREENIAGSMAAMRRAARRARELARDTGTPLVVVRNGKIVHVKIPKNAPGSRRKRKVGQVK